MSHIMMNSKIPNINYIQYTHIKPNTNINYLMTWRECIYFLRLSVTFYLYVKCILYTNPTIYTVDICEWSSNQIHITYTIHWITHSAFSSFITQKAKINIKTKNNISFEKYFCHRIHIPVYWDSIFVFYMPFE